MTGLAAVRAFGNSFARTVTAACIAIVAVCAPGAARAESPGAYMQRVHNELLTAQRSGSISAFSNVLRMHMDVPSVGLTALGPHAASLPKSERPAYFGGMIKFIAKYAATEAPKYPVASAVVVGQDPAGSTVDSRITLRSGVTYDVRWKLVRRGDGYKVRDAQVIGFWMTSFLDNLFQNYISENGNNPRALVIALNR